MNKGNIFPKSPLLKSVDLTRLNGVRTAVGCAPPVGAILLFIATTNARWLLGQFIGLDNKKTLSDPLNSTLFLNK